MASIAPGFAREVESDDIAREAAKARLEEERRQHWESLVSQAAEQEAKARRLVATYGLEKAKEALAAELRQEAEALEAKVSRALRRWGSNAVSAAAPLRILAKAAALS